MEKTINGRIREVRRNFCRDSNIEFAKKIGERPNTVNNWVREGYSVGRGVASKIACTFPVSLDWILTGKGDMLVTEYSMIPGIHPLFNANDVSNEYAAANGGSLLSPFQTRLIPISAKAEPIKNFIESGRIQSCEIITSPVRNIDFAITMSDDSMAPLYPNGSQLLVKSVKEDSFLEWGKVYVLDTCNGTIVKEIQPSEDPDEFVCSNTSADTRYKPFKVNRSSILGIYRIVACLITK